jgi:energy-converting hydrogenase Eha subunit A
MLSLFQLKKESLKLSILCITLLFSAVIFIYKPWVGSNRSPIKHDVSGYYLYLPSILIYKDVNAAFLSKNPEVLHAGRFTYTKEDNTGYINKYPIGLAFAYLPFFLLAHVASLLFGYTADGYSTLYLIAMAFHPILYLGIGLSYLSKSLLFYFKDTSIILTICCLALGTNLFFYSTFGGNMPHVYLFALLSIILYYSIIWYQTPTLKATLILFFCIGLSTIIRPTAFQFILIPLLLNYKSFISQLNIFFAQWSKILLGLIVFSTILSTLFIYWKLTTGSFIYYSYRDEKFDFLHPHIFEVLIGFKKGLLVYTPILIFALIGFWKLKNRIPNLYIAIVVFLISYIYVTASWGCWWYGGSFGMRALVETFPILAFPMTAFFETILSKRPVYKISIACIAGLFVLLNLFQSAQYLKSVIYFEGMNYKAYYFVFGKLSLTEQEQITLTNLLKENN